MPVPPGMKHPSRNEIAASFGLSQSSVSKRMTGKVLSYGTCPWWCTKGQSVRCRYVSSDIDIWGRCRIMSNQ